MKTAENTDLAPVSRTSQLDKNIVDFARFRAKSAARFQNVDDVIDRLSSKAITAARMACVGE